jgi:hypothetical protein
VTTQSVAAPGAGAAERVRAVRHRFARRGDRATVRGRAYAAYLLALLALLYLLPLVRAVKTSPVLLPAASDPRVTPVACALAVAACWGAQLAGRFWGPLVLHPFLLHVLASTDLPPAGYLGTIARRRLAYAGTAALLALCAAAYLTTDLFGHPGTALLALALAAGLGAVTAAAWLWGQVRALPGNAGLACAAAAAGVVVTGAGRALPDAGDGPWLLAGVLAAAAAVLARAALRSVGSVDLAGLARESARAAQALTYAGTGTLHHALDLYRPEPRGFTSVLVRPDGRLRGHLAQGAVRALRTPGRAGAAMVLVPAGGAVLTLGAGGPEGPPALVLWVAGALCVYLGSGWASETWRGLRDELTMAPLFGGRWGGTLARTLAWPVTAVTAGAFLGGGLVLTVQWARPGGPAAHTLLLVAGSVLLVLAARFLREMKLHLPLELLVPVITPFGDLSAVRVVLWQFDGPVTVVTGVAVLSAVPSAPGAAGLAVVMAACCAGAGLRRTGRAYRRPLRRPVRG